MSEDQLFSPMWTDPAVAGATSDLAWLQAMLDTEGALARVCARAGLIPEPAASAIEAGCRADRYDPVELGRLAVDHASPVVPLVAQLRAALPEDAARYVHPGATSQDILDTAMCLVATRASEPVLADLAGLADRLAGLADRYRNTVQIGRTLLQQAAPTTFGAVCAGWLVAVDQARAGLDRARRRLAVQFGGPVGTLAAFGERGPELLAMLAAELGLAEPVLPWHTDRTRIGELAGALGVAAGALGTIALDVALLAQTEVGELAEGSPGGSSSMPHKRNPARSVLVTAAVHRTPGLVATLLAAMPQELQRAAGRWQAEPPVLTELLRLVGGAAAHTRRLVEDLRVDADRMRANLDASGLAAGASGSQAVAAAGALVERALNHHTKPSTRD
ncbi:MAG: 3-carboxy-cis,cis-muconate cycloisomerase [Micromonosporaceae bacterium]|nr:3-carboxy-cis,cis-muconate cycloisomerase [Micromonosporaceae bacterium]